VTDKRKVFIHIGAPKSGTTFLQQIMHTNRRALREAGVLYPVESHFRASLDLRGIQFKSHFDPAVPGAWRRLIEEVRRWPGTAVIDHEILAAARKREIDRAMADLGGADVHIIWTERDLARQLPAAWQESLKNGNTSTFADYLASVQAGGRAGGRPAKVFWGLHNSPAVLARWSRGLPADRVHVVTVPPSGSDPLLLWQRFAGVIGVDPDRFNARVGGENTSLGAAEAAALRELNVRLADAGIPWPVYAATIKHGVPPRLGNRRGSRIELPENSYKWAERWSRNAVGKLREAGYHVVGDLDELLPAARPTGVDPDHVPAEERADAAVAMLAATLQVVAQRGLRGRRRSSRRDRLETGLRALAGRAGRLGRVSDHLRRRRS
jgi:hypothetical protein